MKSVYLNFIFLFCVFKNSLADEINFTIQLNNKIEPSKMKIFYSDGAVRKFITVVFSNKQAIVKEEIKSRYARIILMYPDRYGNMPGICFLINHKKSFIQFYDVNDLEKNQLTKYRSSNLIIANDTKVFKELNTYTKIELKTYNDISFKNAVKSDDILLKMLDKSYELLALKQIEFIKINSKKYFYFEKFINEIVPALKSKHLLQLYEIFNKYFPSYFKETYEGKAAKELLEGKLFVKMGMQVPSFITNDYQGKQINSEELRHKYYLLIFWATWCSPCLKEIPQLINFRNRYSTEKLEMISISRDTDSSRFVKGIENYKMNWSHVFNNRTMENLFGDKPIPSLYLIDKNGKIIFSSWELPMDKLDEILTKELN